MIGKTIAHYKILDKIGEGGMGVVYKAEDTKLQRIVALKCLPSRSGESEADKARFLQEARAAAALNHPNICTVYGIEEHEGASYIAMEYIDGQTLHEKRATINAGKAIDIGIQVAEGLAAAHEKGIVHRDIKPDNVMVRKDGIVQIMDFGLARLSGSTQSRLTREGSTVGTAGYMSPEQVQGQEADHRSDIFSLGVLLYELFTGELPFKGVHETALMYEIVNVDPAPMSAVKPELDPELDRIVLECLQKDPDERYNAVKDIAKDLKRFKRESSRQRMSRVTSARPALVGAHRTSGTGASGTGTADAGADSGMTDGKTSRIAWLGYGLAALLAVALGVVLFGPGKQTGSPAVPALHYIMELPPATPATAGVSGIFSISRDGSLLAYRGGPSNQPQIFLRRMADTAFRPLPGTERGADPAFSPDGQWIAYRAARARLMKLSITGGAPEVVCQLPGDTRGIHWGTDGYIYFGIVNDAVQRVPASGGTPEPATRLDSAAGELSHRYPVLLPDGKTLLFTIKPSDISTFDDAVIAAEQVSGTGRKVLVRGGSYPRYLHSGHLMYLRGNSILAVPFDADRVESTGQAVEVGQGGWMLAGAGSAAIDVSDNGLLVYAPSGPINGNTQTLSWLDRSGKSSPLLDTLRSYSQASLSPDGQKVAVGVAAANNDVWIYNIPRNQLSRLTFGGGNNDFPIWSPDGKYVVYSAEKGKALNIFRKPWDGSGKEERLTSGPGAQYASTISPDGRTLVYSSGGDIFAMPIGEPSGPREPRVLFGTPTIEAGGLVSPDGRWLAYLSDESGKRELFVTSFPKCEGKWQVSNGGAAGHLWSRDGRELFYFNADAVMSVEVKPGPAFDYSTPRRVLTVPASVVIEDIAPDGRRFLVRNVPQDQALLTRFAVITDWFDRVRSKFEGTGR